MPKVKSTLKERIQKEVRNNPDLAEDGSGFLFSKVCKHQISFDSKHGTHFIKSHIESKKHVLNKTKFSKQELIKISFENVLVKRK